MNDLSGRERLRRLVIQRVAPHAGVGIEGERAVDPAQARRSDCLEMVLASVDIGNRQLTTRLHRAAFRKAAPEVAGDRGGVVSTVDGDVDLPGDQAAVLVVERDGEALD